MSLFNLFSFLGPLQIVVRVIFLFRDFWEEHQIRGSISIVTSLVQFEKRESEAHMTLEERVRRFERQEIKNTLLLYGRDMEGKQKAAKELGISLATLYNKIKE